MPHAAFIVGSWVPAIAASPPSPSDGEWEVSCFRVLNAVLVVFYAARLCLCACVLCVYVLLCSVCVCGLLCLSVCVCVRVWVRAWLDAPFFCSLCCVQFCLVRKIK